VWLSLTWQLLQFLLEHGHFWNIAISQGSVATQLSCGGMFKYGSVAKLITTESASERILKIG